MRPRSRSARPVFRPKHKQHPPRQQPKPVRSQAQKGGSK